MNSREAILNNIKNNKPESGALPEVPSFSSQSVNLTARYRASLEGNGGTSIAASNFGDIEAYVQEVYGPEAKICSRLPEIKGNVDINDIDTPHLLENLDVAIVKGVWAASENAAIWLPEEQLHHRALPFIAQHLIVVLEEKSILYDLHDLYRKVDISQAGYGVLIAGPSKTADIEQSLVIGAHGARSMVVFIISESNE